MMLLRGTRKVLKLLGQRPRQVELSQADAGLAEWYANIIEGLGPALFLCTNPATLYTLVLPAGDTDDVADLSGRLVSRLTRHMAELRTDRAGAERLIHRLGTVLVAKTASRSVLGSMSDLTSHFCRHFSRQMTENGKVDIRAIEQELNNMPQRPLGWQYAQERFAKLCSRL